MIPLFAASVFAAQGAYAQEEFIPPPSQVLTTVTFSLAPESVILIKGVLVGNPDTLNFILDTGSSGISLDSKTAGALGLVPEESDINIRGLDGVRKAKFLTAKKPTPNYLHVPSHNIHHNPNK